VHLLLLLLAELGSEPLSGECGGGCGGALRRRGKSGRKGEEHVRRGGVVRRGDRRRGCRIRASIRRRRRLERRRRVVAMVRLVLDHMRGGCDGRLIRLAAVEVAVAAAGCAFNGAGVGSSGCGGRHELAAAV